MGLVGLRVDPSCLRMDSEETLPALRDERSVMSCVDLGVTLDGGPMEGAPVLEPLEHSVLEMALDGELIENLSVLETLEHSVLEVTLVWGDCSLIKMTVSDPLEHSGLGVTVHVDMDSLWMAPWDHGTHGTPAGRLGLDLDRDGLFEVFWRPRKDMYYRLERWGVDSPS